MHGLHSIYRWILVCIISIFVTVAYATTEEENQGIHLVMVPGIKGAQGHKDFEVSPIRDYIKLPEANYHLVDTPLYTPDMGQKRCQEPLIKLMDGLLDREDVIEIFCFGTSQGGGTLLNVLKDPKYHSKIKAVILQSPLVTATSGITHCVKNFCGSDHRVIDLAFPHLARVVFPFYDPWGPHAIEDLDKLPQVPFFIAHPKYDPVTPYAGSKAIAYGLEKWGYKVELCTPLHNLHCGIFVHSDNEHHFVDYKNNLPRFAYGNINFAEDTKHLFYHAGRQLRKFLETNTNLKLPLNTHIFESIHEDELPCESSYNKFLSQIETDREVQVGLGQIASLIFMGSMALFLYW